MTKKIKKVPPSSSEKDDLFLKFTTYMCTDFIDNFIPDLEKDRNIDEDYFDAFCGMMNNLTLLAKYLIWDSDFDIESETYEDYLEDFASSVEYAMEIEYGYSNGAEGYLREYIGEFVYEFCKKIKRSEK